jgi:membrane fusion protein, adhesin transport system
LTTEAMQEVRSSLKAAPLSLQLPVDASRRFLFITCAGLGTFLLWAANFSLDKVTRGSGRVLPSVQNQIVQHLEGGIVKAVLVREGQLVRKDQVLMHVSNQFTDAEASNVGTDVTSRKLALARMDSEVRGDSQPRLPVALEAAAPEIAASERAIFLSRRSQLHQQYAILDDQARSLSAEVNAARERLGNLRSEEALVERQLSSLEKALAAEAISEHDVLEKRTSLQQLRTRIGETTNAIPKAQADLSEVRARRQEIWTRFVSETKEKMAQLGLEMAKSRNALGAYQDRRNRGDLRAPMDGVVNKLYVQTIGGVVRGGEPLVEIVPADKNIMVEAQLAPKDRGKIWPGLPATVKISAYEYSIHGGLPGKVIDISADAFQEKDGRSFYRVRLQADTQRFGAQRPVVPGMTAEVDIKSGKHTVLQYLLEPISDIRAKALRD